MADLNTANCPYKHLPTGEPITDPTLIKAWTPLSATVTDRPDPPPGPPIGSCANEFTSQFDCLKEQQVKKDKKSIKNALTPINQSINQPTITHSINQSINQSMEQSLYTFLAAKISAPSRPAGNWQRIRKMSENEKFCTNAISSIAGRSITSA